MRKAGGFGCWSALANIVQTKPSPVLLVFCHIPVCTVQSGSIKRLLWTYSKPLSVGLIGRVRELVLPCKMVFDCSSWVPLYFIRGKRDKMSLGNGKMQQWVVLRRAVSDFWEYGEGIYVQRPHTLTHSHQCSGSGYYWSAYALMGEVVRVAAC